MNNWRHVTAQIARTKTVFAVIFVTSVLGIAASTVAFISSGSREQLPADFALMKPMGSDQRGRVLPTQTIRFTLYQEGIFPRKARAHKGPVAILVEDLVGTGSTLVVERLTGNGKVNTGQIRRSEKHLRGRSVIDLKPGRYRLSIAERPDNEAELTVEP